MAQGEDDVRFLRQAIEDLESKAKSDLKVALYGSSALIVVSLSPVGHLERASLLVAAIDLWYFMSWGSDQLRLVQDREELKKREGTKLESNLAKHPNHSYERFLYHSTSLIVVAFFIISLVMDYDVISATGWRIAYYALVSCCFVIIVSSFFIGLVKSKA